MPQKTLARRAKWADPKLAMPFVSRDRVTNGAAMERLPYCFPVVRWFVPFSFIPDAPVFDSCLTRFGCRHIFGLWLEVSCLLALMEFALFRLKHHSEL